MTTTTSYQIVAADEDRPFSDRLDRLLQRSVSRHEQSTSDTGTNDSAQDETHAEHRTVWVCSPALAKGDVAIPSEGVPLLVLAAGDLVWDDGSARFDHRHSNALPANALDVFATEPRWADVRRLDGALPGRRDPEMLDAVADLTASITGKPKGEILAKDERLVRRSRRLFAAGVSLLSAVLVLALVATAAALWQASQAASETRVAESVALAAQSLQQQPGDADDAFVLSVAGGHDGAVEYRALYRAVSELAGGSVVRWGDGIAPSGIAYRGESAVVGRTDGTLLRWNPDAPGGSPIAIEIIDHGPGESPVKPLLGKARSWSVAEDGTITTWETDFSAVLGSGRLTEAGEGIALESIVWSETAELIVWGTDDGDVVAWDPMTESEAWRLGDVHVGPVLAIAAHPSRSLIATAGWDGSIRLVELDINPRAVGVVLNSSSIDAHDPGVVGTATAVAFNDVGDHLATGSIDGRIRVFTVEPFAPLSSNGFWLALQFHQGPVASLGPGPDGTFVSTGDDGHLRIWDLTTSELDRKDVAGSARPIAAVGPEDGRVLAVSRDGTISSVSLDENPELGVEIAEVSGIVGDERPPVDNRLVYSTFDRVGLWDVLTRGEVGHSLEAAAAPLSRSLHPNGSWIATTTNGSNLVLWDAAEGIERDEIDVGFVLRRVRVSPDGRYVALLGTDRSVLVEIGPDGEFGDVVELAGLAVQGHAPVRFYEGGAYLVAADREGDGLVFQTSDGRHIATIETKGSISALTNASGGIFLTISVSGIVQEWRVTDWTPEAFQFQVGSGPSSASLIDDGRFLVVGRLNGTLELWDAESRALVLASRATGSVQAVINPIDVMTMLVSDGSGTSKLWALSPETVKALGCAHLVGADLEQLKSSWGIGPEVKPCEE